MNQHRARFETEPPARLSHRHEADLRIVFVSAEKPFKLLVPPRGHAESMLIVVVDGKWRPDQLSSRNNTRSIASAIAW